LIAELTGGKLTVIKILPCGDEVKDDSGQAVGCSSDRFRSAEFGSHAAVEIAERTFAVVQGLGGHTESRGRAALHFARTDPEDSTAADIVIWKTCFGGGICSSAQKPPDPRLCAALVSRSCRVKPEP
jgi:hypothetical protein